MQDTFNSKEPKISAIIFFPPTDARANRPAKYSYVDNKPNTGVKSFLKFVRREFPTATYINFYSNLSGSHLGRIYL